MCLHIWSKSAYYHRDYNCACIFSWEVHCHCLGTKIDFAFEALQDSNLGLVKQVVSSLYKRNIQRLTQTFVTLSLEDIASTVQLASPKEAELHILRMVSLFTLFFCVYMLNSLSQLYHSSNYERRWTKLHHNASRFRKGKFLLPLIKRMAWSAFMRTLSNTRQGR